MAKVKNQRRKELRKPDEFVTLSMKIGQWIRDHQRLVVFSAIVIVVVVVGVALTVQLTQSSRVSSSAELLAALETAGAPVISEEDAEDIPEGIRYYKNLGERNRAALKAFEKVVKSGASGAPGRAAKLGLASSKLAAGDYGEARQLYEEFLADPDGLASLDALAVEGLGLSYEGLRNYDKALEQFRNLEKLDDGDHQDLAKYHQGRMLEKLNKRDTAADLYRGIVRRGEQATEGMVTNGWAREQAEKRLAVLDPGADVLRRSSKNRGSELLKQLLQGRGGQGGALPRLPRKRN